MTIADSVALLEAERAALADRVRKLEGDQSDVARRMYRRGYLAGRSAQRRGAPAVTNPERLGRGETRELTA
jgi:hypothetical protein